MTYEERMDEVLEINMSERGFSLWKALKQKLPEIWEKSSSSTGKYHKKHDGSVPSIIIHTYEMLSAGIKLFRMLNIKKNTTDADTLLLGIVLHDSLKYGLDGNLLHTTREHDRLIGDLIKANKATFLKLLNEDQFTILEEGVRYHSGRWSSDVDKNKPFDFKDYNPIAVFIHTLDMLSTADRLRTNFKET